MDSLKPCQNRKCHEGWLGPTEVAGDGLGFQGIHKAEDQRIP